MSALPFASLERVAAAWCGWMAERATDGLVALAVVLPIVALARRRSPHFRAALLLLALAPLLVPMPRLPLALRALPSVSGALANRLAPSQRSRSAAPDAADERAPAAPSAATAPAAAAITSPATPRAAAPLAGRWRSALFLAWLAAVAGLLARWFVHELRLRRALRDGRPVAAADLPVDESDAPALRAARVVECDALAAPATTGWLRPTIVLPAALRRSLASAELRFVLLHELAHVRRGDLWTGALERLIRIAWCFHPAPWIVGRLLEDAREAACDDAALSRFPRGERRACAAAFLKVVELAGAAPPRFTVAAALSRGGRSIRSRIMRMVQSRRLVPDRLSRPAWLALAASGAALLLALQPARALAPQAQEGDPPALTTAVRRAGEWLVQHQEPAGYWSASEFGKQCKCDGAGERPNDVGVTGLALLALTKERQLAPDARLEGAIERAGRFLASVQDSEDGCIGAKSSQHFMYGHALASLALAELQIVAPSAERSAVLGRALAFIARSRNPYKGWRYSFPPDGDNDASVTSAMLLALGRAMEAGVPVDARTVDDGLHYLDEMTDPANGRTGYHEVGSACAREAEDIERFPAELSESLTAAALHARVAHDDSFVAKPVMQRGAALLAAKRPTWDAAGGAVDFYYWFHGTEALRAAGGPAWTRWRAAVVPALLDHQRKDGHAAGSFDPQVDPWGNGGGRVYSTAMNLLTLAAAAGS